MANNVQITAGSGTTIETIDEGSGVERQVIVLGSIGKSGSETQLTGGQNTSANSIPIVIASDQSTIAVKQTRSSTGTQSSVASSATDVTVLASNANRLGAIVYNDSTQILYLLLASGKSSSSNYSVQLAANDYYEVPAFYTGVIKGIWTSANGNARVTEFS